MIHHVFANKSNIGDWLSALAIQSLLAPIPITEHLCDEPFVPETLDQLKEAGPKDMIVIGGGGLFMDYFVPFWQGFREIAGRTPFCIWGVGYCDLKREMSRPPAELLSEIVAKSQFCAVRDELTHQLLAACHLPPPTACPSICLIEPSASPGCGVLHVDNYTTAGEDVYASMQDVALEFAEATRRPFRTTNNRITAGSKEELAAILDRYRSSDIVVSSALHGCVIGVAMRRKVLAVSGDRKIESFMEAAGLGEWVCDLDEVDRLHARLVRVHEQQVAREFLQQTKNAHQTYAERCRMGFLTRPTSPKNS